MGAEHLHRIPGRPGVGRNTRPVGVVQPVASGDMALNAEDSALSTKGLRITYQSVKSAPHQLAHVRQDESRRLLLS